MTRGPGATQAAVGVHTARQDSTPMLLLVGQVPRAFRGREAWQELDYAHAFGSIAKAAWEVDNDVKRTNTSAIAKAMGADLAMKCTTDAVQVFGGYGYTKEYPVEKLMRDAKLMQIYEGTSQVQRMVIAKNLLMRS